MTTKIKSYCINCKKQQTIIVDSVVIDGATQEETMKGCCEKCGAKIVNVRRLG